MDKQKISFDMGLRLKDLREARGLSYQGLADTLFNNYGIKISKDSLRDYEISSDYRSKAKSLPNLGMRTEYLYVLADFYGVSTDYLLGLSPVPSLDADIQQACKYTHLSKPVITWLHCENEENLQILNLLLSNYSFRRLTSDIAELKELIEHAGAEFQDTIENLSSNEQGDLDEMIVSQYSELAKQIGGLHLVDDFEYFHMREYNIDKKLSEIIESILYCERDGIINDMKELVFNIKD